MLDDSLQEVGLGRSVVTDKNGVIIAGNKTAERAIDRGFDEAIVVHTQGDKLVVVQRDDLDLVNDDDQRKARALAYYDNRVAEADLQWIPEQIEADRANGMEIVDKLWSPVELDILGVGSEEPTEDPGAQIDRAGELQEKWQVKRGDVWQVGKHRVMCGDSSISKDTDELLFWSDGTVILCHADPPYGMGKEKDGIINDNLYNEKLDEFQMAWWDSCRRHLAQNANVYIWGNAEDLWRLWYCGGLRDSERLTVRNEIVWDKGSGQGMLADGFRSYAPGSERCLFFMRGEQQMSVNADNYWDGWENIRLYLKEQKELMGWDSHQMKQIAGGAPNGHGDHWTGRSQWTMPTRAAYEAWQKAANDDAFKREYDAFKREYDDIKREYDDIKREYDDIKREYDDIKREWMGKRAYFDNTHDNMTDVWQYPRVAGEERWQHATPKPVEMIERIIKSSSEINDNVYDPFLGSGTTIVACEQTGRIGYGMEISEAYCAVTLERLAGMGLSPERISHE
jgi:DNA modification methylase